MSIWHFNLQVDWEGQSNTINGKRFYPCKNGGCLVIHPDNTIQFYSKNWFE